MSEKQLAIIICIGAIFVISLLIYIIMRASRCSDGFAVIESLLEIGVIILDLLTSILSGL